MPALLSNALGLTGIHYLSEYGKDPPAPIGLCSAPARLSGRHVRRRHRSAPVLSVRRVQIPGSGFAILEGGAERAVAIVHIADAARTDAATRRFQASGLYFSRRRFRTRG